ncbi:MAG: hypothetical protein WKH64_12890 [Chloroflexia bacterium]
MQASCPGARLFNYTNPINIVSEAVCRYTDIPTVSLCEGRSLSLRGSRALQGSTRTGWTR